MANASSVGALQAWRTVVGPENVLTGAADLASAEAATFQTAQRILAIIRPAGVSEVEACVKIANQFKTPIYPISRGRNWGLGSRVPVRTGCALLDLGRLDRIVDYSEKLGYITVQPGVTFRQVQEFLLEQKSRLFAAVTGGPPDGSLVGNALERGEGSGPYGDRAAHVCGLEVVLPSGVTIRTGFGRFSNASTAPLSQWGVGPFLDGLFIQSNLGIVTELTVWLQPRPKYLEKFVVPIDDTAHLEAVVDAIRPLVLQGTIGGHSFGLWNAYKIMAVSGRYPWQAMKHQTPLRLRDHGGREPWAASGALYAASAEQRTAGRKLVKAALTGLPSAPTFESVRATAIAEEPWSGMPTTRNLRSMYWRKKTDPTSFSGYDPHRHQCGVMWLHPTLPFVGAHVVKAARLMESVTAAHGFEPLIGMSCATARIINVYLALIYDREIRGEDERAMACHDELLERLIGEGYPPYRLGVQSMESIPASGSPYEDLLRTLKTAMDPNDILAPGRYDFRRRPRFDRNGRLPSESRCQG
jgi:4-cresol dehydrogenase (hydroxylating) flavoprotein subunit